MKIHEYQAKELLAQFTIPVPKGKMVTNAGDAGRAADEIGGTVVVKAQIHAGGRGKGGGIKLARSPEETRACAEQILGMRLVTHQTGPEGKIVHKVLVEEALEIEKELYLGMVIDRESSQPVIIASEEGGVEIEVVADRTPEKILKEFMDPRVGMQPFNARKITFGLNLPEPLIKQGAGLLMNLYRLFHACDCSLAEINPLVITKDGRMLAADAKINFDDNALGRHPDIVALRDLSEEEPTEIEAAEQNLSYIKLDGNVGCMVNGAGLAMATMDIIQHYGGMPANFLDVGGAASAERVEKAFKILLADGNVKAVLINIFGGIVRCDRVANGVIEAAKRLEVNVPIVIRLAGTNADLAAELLERSDLEFTVAHDLAEAASKAVAAVSR
ncbi:ADP-forming succinate--CoA ligase subunit beta [bacterium]|nr:ADP-forming succinate--CoA ligase subunit beta [bacterium]